MNMIAPDDEGSPGTKDRVEVLRYRIACCRAQLHAGPPAAMEIWFFAEIQRAEAELLLLAEEPAAEDATVKPTSET